MPAPLFDSHCHPTWKEEEAPPAEVLARARQAGVEEFLFVAIDARTARRSRELAAAEPGARASVGIHPNDLPSDPQALEPALEEIQSLAREDGWSAVGETGLDFHWDTVPPAIQREGLAFHLDLAHERDLPVVLHCRRAAPALLDLLQGRGEIRGVMHCWSEPSEHLAAFLDLGLHVSFAGNLTYRRSGDLREAARRVPADRLLLETDSPFLAPQPRRGRRNEPGFLPFTLACLAEVRGEAPEAVAERTTANARRLFPQSRG